MVYFYALNNKESPLQAIKLHCRVRFLCYAMQKDDRLQFKSLFLYKFIFKRWIINNLNYKKQEIKLILKDSN